MNKTKKEVFISTDVALGTLEETHDNYNITI